MNMTIKNRVIATLIMVVFSADLGFSQCQKISIKEMTGSGKSLETFIIEDSIVYHFDKSGNLSTANFHLMNGSTDGGVRFEAFYEAKGDDIIKEKIVAENEFVAMEWIQQIMPPYSGLERKLVNKSGNLVALETMTGDMYGIKYWEGVDSEGNVYVKYQFDIARNGKPALYYTYKEIDGIWETYEILIQTPNEHGDYVTTQWVQAAGYGYSISNRRYEYDDCGNWIKKYAEIAPGNYHLVAVREIKYLGK